jgi:hypothetical protein
MIFDKNKILSPWESFDYYCGWKRTGFIKRVFFGEPVMENVKYKAFKRSLIKPTGMFIPSYYFINEDTNGMWVNSLDNRFIITYKNKNNAMSETDKILIREGFYLIDDCEKFEKLKVLI